MDMREDVFAEFTFGQIALEKMASTDPNFKLYVAGWMGNGTERQVMKVTGAVFRESSRGPSKGQLSIMVPKSSRTVYVTAAEMAVREQAPQKVA